MSWLSSLISGSSPSDADRQQAANMQAYLDAKAAQQQQIDAYNAQQAAAAANQPSDYDKALQAYQLQNLQTQQQRDALRQNALASLGSTFSPDYEYSALPSSYDAPYIQSAYATQRSKVDDYLNNLLKRGVITQAGYQGGEAAAEEQAPTVRSQLQNLGDTLLAAQRGRLTDIGNRAQGAASSVDVGQTFDPSVYVNQLTQTEKDIGNQFGDLYAGSIPSGGLFDLTSLASKAGAAQGAQNLAFDPNAVAGATPGAETDTTDMTTPAKKRSTAVF